MRGSPGGIPSTPGSSIFDDVEVEADRGGEEAAPVPAAERDGGETASSFSSEESSDSLPPVVDSEEEEKKDWNDEGDPYRIRCLPGIGQTCKAGWTSS